MFLHLSWVSAPSFSTMIFMNGCCRCWKKRELIILLHPMRPMLRWHFCAWKSMLMLSLLRTQTWYLLAVPKCVFSHFLHIWKWSEFLTVLICILYLLYDFQSIISTSCYLAMCWLSSLPEMPIIDTFVFRSSSKWTNLDRAFCSRVQC